MRSIIFVSLLLALAAGSICAQNAAKAATFTSSYTSLSTGCKSYSGGDGQDGFSLCKGPGRYQVRIYYSATMMHIVAELKGADDTFLLANVSLGFNQSKSKVEWRLANGKPFAAIFRLPTYADPADGEAGVGKVIGEELAIVGLKGFENLTASIDAKSANANAKARKTADVGYFVKH